MFLLCFGGGSTCFATVLVADPPYDAQSEAALRKVPLRHVPAGVHLPSPAELRSGGAFSAVCDPGGAPGAICHLYPSLRGLLEAGRRC